MWSLVRLLIIATGTSQYCSISLCSATYGVINRPKPRPHRQPSCASYGSQHCDGIVASVSLNLQDLRKNQDDAVLGLHDCAIKRNVVRKRLWTRGEERFDRCVKVLLLFKELVSVAVLTRKSRNLIQMRKLDLLTDKNYDADDSLELKWLCSRCSETVLRGSNMNSAVSFEYCCDCMDC